MIGLSYIGVHKRAFTGMIQTITVTGFSSIPNWDKNKQKNKQNQAA